MFHIYQTLFVCEKLWQRNPWTSSLRFIFHRVNFKWHNRMKSPSRPIHLKRCPVFKNLFTHFIPQPIQVCRLEKNFCFWLKISHFDNGFVDSRRNGVFHSCSQNILTFVCGLNFSRAFSLTATKNTLVSKGFDAVMVCCVAKTFQSRFFAFF